MNSQALILVAALVAGVSGPLGAAPFTYESETELSTALDADGDGLPDLVVVDKNSGVRQLAMQQGDGSFLWSEPVSTGLDNVTALSAGRFTPNTASEGYAVAAPTWNRVVVFPDVNGPSVVAPTTGIGPNMVAAFDLAGDNLDDLAIATEWDNPPEATHLAGVQISDLGLSVVSLPSVESGALTHGNRARFKSDRAWLLGATRPGSSSTEFITRPFFSFPGFAQGPTLTGLATNTTWTAGEFAPGAYTQFLFYAPGSSALQAPGLTERDSFQFVWTAGSTFDLGQAISQVVVLPDTTGALLLVIFGDGSTAATYDFDGVNPPVVRQTLNAPPGMKFSLAGALGAGNFLLLNGPNGGQGNSTGWQHWKRDGAQHTLAASDAIPPFMAYHARANVLLFAANPDTSSGAPLVQSLRVGEWSTAAAVSSALQVTYERSRASALGLGDALTTNVNSAAASLPGIVPVVNQRSAGESAVVFDPPASQLNAAITFSPPPGTYHLAANAALEVHITAAPPAPVFFRPSLGLPWTPYDPSNPPRITTSTTFLAYAGGPTPTPIRTAAYVIGDPPPLAPAAPVDANHNGLPDSWEQIFGITDPNADADGDGFTNLQEFQAGTDPLDPSSVPSTTDLGHVNLIARPPGDAAPPGTLCEIAWPAHLTGALLESTLDLNDPAGWAPALGAAVTVGSEDIHYEPAGTAVVRRFFRLHQQP